MNNRYIKLLDGINAVDVNETAPGIYSFSTLQNKKYILQY